MNSALMLHKHGRPAVAGTYLLGAVLGALTTGAGVLLGAGLLSPIPSPVRATALGLAMVLLTLHATRLLCLALPERRYQIPRDTFNDDPRTAAFRFAFELGLGFRTYITAVSPYALALVLLLADLGSLAASVLATATAAIGFGVGRSRIVAAHALAGSIALEHPKSWLRAADLTTLAIIASVAIRSTL